MRYIKAGLVCLLFVANSVVNAQDVGTDRQAFEMQSVSLYFVEQENKQSVSQTYKNTIEMINKIAERHKFKNYKIISQGLGVSHNSYSTNNYEVGISVYLEMPFNYKGIDIFASETTLATISTSMAVQKVWA